MIKFGDSGYDVIELQLFLKANGFKVEADGEFGKITLAAVKAFQHRVGIAQDGIIGPVFMSYMTSFRDSAALGIKSKVLKMAEKIPDRFKVKLVAVRDFKVSDGNNQFGTFDDAFFVISPNSFRYFKANTDPSRVGWNQNAGKQMAQLDLGLHYFIKGMHKQKYRGFRQPNKEVEDEVSILVNSGLTKSNCDFTVNRVAAVGSDKNYKETGYYAINIHPGGVSGSTSSEGCQTLPYAQFDEFRDHTYNRLDAFGQKVLPFLLVNGPVY